MFHLKTFNYTFIYYAREGGERTTDNGKGWLYVGLSFVIGVAICAVTYYYTHFMI
jgi:hypothetical protein